MRIRQLFISFFALPISAVRAWHNVTYDANNAALLYQPGPWLTWPANGCLAWPNGRWTSKPGNITLYFEGVAIYAYALFDDSINPIYTIRVDDDTPARRGDVSAPAAQRCDPLFSKTEMTYSKHRVIFNITNERPFDVKDLSFQGFIVTVPDPGDGVEFNTTVPYTNITLPVPAPTSTSSSSGSHSSSLTATITKISSIVGTIIFILIASCCVWGCIRGCCSCSGGSRRPSVRPRTSGGLPLQRRESANNTNFPPPPPPYEPPRTAAPIPDSPYSPYPTPAAPTPQSPPPATPSPAFLPRKDPIVPPSPISPWLAQNSTTPAEKPVRPASSLAGPSGQPSALYASIWGNPTADTKPTLIMPTPPNPVRTARPQSPAWQDSSEALD